MGGDMTKRGVLAQLIAALAVVFFGAVGCGTAPVETPQAQAQSEVYVPDSTTIVLSKFYRNRSYRNWLGRLAAEAGHGPLRFVQAYGAADAALAQALDAASAVVLTGGEDVHPGRYGQAADTERCGRIDVERDRVELLLLDRVVADGTPCLGVCRGLQVMNVYGGGSLHPHLPDAGYAGHRGGKPGNTKDTVHNVEVTTAWLSGGVGFDLGTEGEFISHHHQGIDRLSSAFMGWAKAPGGLIEGIRYRDTVSVPFLVGVQWHPERSQPGHVLSDGVGLALLRNMAVESAPRRAP